MFRTSKFPQLIRAVGFLFICTLALSSCGGGGGSSEEPPPVSTPPGSSPNTQWSPPSNVIIDGKSLQYSFGSGNPKQVELPTEQYVQKDDQVRGIPYVTPEAEQAMMVFLQDPFLPELLSKCKKIIESNKDESDFQTSVFSYSIDGFSINNLLYVDGKSGRKYFKYIPTISDMFVAFNGSSIRDPLWPKCLSASDSSKLIELSKKFDAFVVKYRNGYNGN